VSLAAADIGGVNSLARRSTCDCLLGTPDRRLSAKVGPCSGNPRNTSEISDCGEIATLVMCSGFELVRSESGDKAPYLPAALGGGVKSSAWKISP